MHDAAESRLQGDVAAKTTGGVIRYRVWPARRHRARLLLVLAVIVAATIGAATVFSSLYWALIVLVGLTAAATPFFFPTEVGLDGGRLNLRALGTPRVWDLREFRRLEVSDDVLKRVELLPRSLVAPMDRVQSVTVPLPDDEAVAELVLEHLRRWVGRRPTGTFRVDVDHAPEDWLDEA